MARFKHGIDLWECPCGEIIAIGKKCWQCGGSYADVLQAKQKAERQPQKREKKYRTPASSGKIIDSFLFKKKKND